jgi:hypothetical protein
MAGFQNPQMSANFKMVWYVLLRSLRPELDGQMSLKFMQSRLPTIITRTLVITVGTLPFSAHLQGDVTPPG